MSRAYPPEVVAFIAEHNAGRTAKEVADLVNATFGTFYTVEQIKGHRARHHLIKARNEIARIKADTAMEIFEGIEKLKYQRWDECEDNYYLDWEDVAELKKKYTEGENDL